MINVLLPPLQGVPQENPGLLVDWQPLIAGLPCQAYATKHRGRSMYYMAARRLGICDALCHVWAAQSGCFLM